VTSPILCKTEDGVEYCCKGFHAGVASLCKEWICANLAKTLDLPIPEFEILDVPLKLFENWNMAKGNAAPVFVHSGCHYVFASKIINRVKDVFNSQELADKKVDALAMGRIMMFDRIIRNCDRTDWNSNLLMTSERNPSIFIIDHNSAFDATFERDDFLRNHILRNFYSNLNQKDKERFFDDVQRLLAEDIVGDIKSRLPTAWLDGLAEHDAEALENLEETIKREME
jgi:hypothetical protein